jgi:hypothetical protein
MFWCRVWSAPCAAREAIEAGSAFRMAVVIAILALETGNCKILACRYHEIRLLLIRHFDRFIGSRGTIARNLAGCLVSGPPFRR